MERSKAVFTVGNIIIANTSKSTAFLLEGPVPRTTRIKPNFKDGFLV